MTTDTGTREPALTGDLRALIAPPSVALIGASDTPGRLTARPQSYLMANRYAGRIIPVNPRRDTVQGLDSVANVTEISGGVDHAYILLDGEPAIAALHDCARAGVRVVSMLADGFAEAGAEGMARQDRVTAIAREANIRLIGPNSTGVVHIPNRFICTSNAAFAAADLPAGGLSVLSQSGSMIGMLLSRGASRGIGFAGFASLGNEAVTDIGTMGQWMLDDPDTDSFALFMETIRDPEALETFARAAHARAKPIVAYVIGQSDEGQQLAVSHTGALTGASGAISAFLRDIGIVQVPVLDALLDAPGAMVRAPLSPARPRSATVLTTTGGGGGMVLDQLSLRGVHINGCGAKTRAELGPRGVSLGSGKLVDVTMAGARPDVMEATISSLRDDPETGVLVVAIGSSAQFNPELTVDPLVAARDKAPDGAAPMVVMPLPHAPETLALLAAKGIPAFASVESCAEGVAALFAARAPSERPRSILPESVSTLLASSIAAASASLEVTETETVTVTAAPNDAGAQAPVILDEVTAGAVFDALGIEGPKQVFYNPADTITCDGVDFPVVAKLVSPDLPHKTEAGAVRVGIHDRDALALAVRDMTRNAEAHAPGYHLRGVLVQDMASGLGEALIGLTRDPRVGPMVTLAAGGVLAEVLRDTALRPAPVSLTTARDMIDEIKSFAPLRGYRGHAQGDLEALAQAIVALSQLAQIPEVQEAEINPVLIKAKGNGIVRLDALIRCERTA